MKRKLMTLGVCGALLFAVAGCGSEGAVSEKNVLAKLEKANKGDALLQEYDSIRVETNYFDETGVDNGNSFWYVEKDMAVQGDDTDNITILRDGDSYGYYNDGETEYPLRVLYMDGVFEAELAYMRENIVFAPSEDEKVTTMSEENGILSVETKISGDKLTGEDENWLTNGESLVMSYTADAQSYRISQIDACVEEKDGSRWQVNRSIVKYDAEPYAQGCRWTGEELYDMTHGEGRTVTLTADPDTKKEKVYSMSVPKGTAAAIALQMDYERYYSDKECTQPYTGNTDGYTTDTVVYAVEGK